MIAAEEIRMIQMLTEAIFPGANEARVYSFILRDMESNPWLVETYRQGLHELNEHAKQNYHANITGLGTEQVNGLLAYYETSAFFRLIREQTLEGLFSDPIYGGNYRGYGWRLLEYEGPKFHPPETLDETKPPTVYYSLEGIVCDDKDGL